MKKRCPLLLKRLCRSVFFYRLLLLTSKCKPDLSSSFCFSALQGPFDSPKGETCQKLLRLCWCSGLENSLLLLILPFICVIYPSVLLGSRHSSVVSHESYGWESCVSLCTWPLLTGSLDLLISPFHCSKPCCHKPNPGDCLFNRVLQLFQGFQKGSGSKIPSLMSFA